MKLEKKKDIGTFFEKKLSDKKIAPNEQVWEKINYSWSREMNLRKRKLFYWIGGVGIFLAIGILLWLGNYKKPLQDSTNPPRKTVIIPMIEPMELEQNMAPFENKDVDSTITREGIEAISGTMRTEENLKKSINKDSINIIKNENGRSKQSEKQTHKENRDEFFSVTTKYYYYNAQDGKKIITSDKTLIDSLLSKTTHPLDSVNIAKKDSLPPLKKP